MTVSENILRWNKLQLFHFISHQPCSSACVLLIFKKMFWSFLKYCLINTRYRLNKPSQCHWLSLEQLSLKRWKISNTTSDLTIRLNNCLSSSQEIYSIHQLILFDNLTKIIIVINLYFILDSHLCKVFTHYLSSYWT